MYIVFGLLIPSLDSVSGIVELCFATLLVSFCFLLCMLTESCYALSESLIVLWLSCFVFEHDSLAILLAPRFVSLAQCRLAPVFLCCRAESWSISGVESA